MKLIEYVIRIGEGPSKVKKKKEDWSAKIYIYIHRAVGTRTTRSRLKPIIPPKNVYLKDIFTLHYLLSLFLSSIDFVTVKLWRGVARRGRYS